MTSSSIRRLVLEEWRGLPENSRTDRTVKVGDALDRLLTRMGLSTLVCEAEILSAWNELVGDFLSMHSRPLRLVDGVLQISVLQPMVRYELDRNWKPHVLRKLRKRFGAGAIREIQFRM